VALGVTEARRNLTRGFVGLFLFTALIGRDAMNQVVAFRPGAELQAKLQTLREDLQQSTSDVMRQVLQVVNVEQLRQASQGESVDERAVVTRGD
jgi:hypothetical protein